MHEVLTTREVADILKVDVVTVQRLFKARKLGGNKVGRSWRMLRSELVDHLNNYTAKAEEAKRFMDERYGPGTAREQIAAAIQEATRDMEGAGGCA